MYHKPFPAVLIHVVVIGQGTLSGVILLLKHDIHACISFAHWKTVLPVSRQHKLQIAFKHV